MGLWLRGDSIETPPPEDRPILEVLPLNTEQRQAVVQGLGAPLTVVTGPPGTGKSQVVTSLLANLAWQGGSVLFSSKNNHAVDVVESRVNDLGPYPLLLRLGKEEHHARIAQHLTAGLAESSSPDDSARYDWLDQGARSGPRAVRLGAARDRVGGGLAQCGGRAGTGRRAGAGAVRRRSDLPRCGRWMRNGFASSFRRSRPRWMRPRNPDSRRWSGCCGTP